MCMFALVVMLHASEQSSMHQGASMCPAILVISVVEEFCAIEVGIVLQETVLSHPYFNQVNATINLCGDPQNFPGMDELEVLARIKGAAGVRVFLQGRPRLARANTSFHTGAAACC